MKEENLILLSEFAISLGVDTAFFLTLEERGLINIIRIEQEIYIDIFELPRLEKIIRLHGELEINVEGIEAITHLLERIENLQNEIVSLENRLRLYE
jgi:chaperone modulatory protein CbpM